MKKLVWCAALAMVILGGYVRFAEGAAPPDDTKMQASSTKDAVSKTADGMAVSGYDVVAYFDGKKATKGDPAIVYEYGGAKYQFISEEHKTAFAKDPEHFIPQFGGYCAYGAAKGHKAVADPEAWTVLDGKLYLNYNKQVQKAFLKDPAAHAKEADRNWQELKK